MSTYVQLDPVFRVQDWDAIRPLLHEAFDKVRTTENDTHAYLFAQDSSSPELLTVNEVYPNGQALAIHLQNVNDILARALNGPCVVDRIYASGPAQELDAVRPLLDPLGSVTYFEAIEGGGVSLVVVSSSTTPLEDPIVDGVEAFVILPVFKVHDWDKAKSDFIDPLTKAAEKEAGCVFFSFARNHDQGLLLVRERYASVDAALQHLASATPILAHCLSEGILELQEASVYGTRDAIDASRSALDPFGTQYRSTLHALDRCQVKSSP